MLQDTQRLQALAATGLGAVTDPQLEPFTRLVARLIDVPIALVSLVDGARQFFPAAVGLSEPLASRHETPLTHSFCQHVVVSGTPLVVSDAGAHPLVCTNLAIPDMGVVAYAGMPLVDGDGRTLGSLCAIDTSPRKWTDAELETLRDLAAACSSELQLRIVAARAEQARRTAASARRRAEQAGARLELLAQATQATTSTLDADAALGRLARVIVPALCDWCAVDVLDGDLVRRVAVEHEGADELEGATWRTQLRVTGDTPTLASILSGSRRSVLLAGEDLRALRDGAQDPLSRAHAALFDALGGDSALLVGLVDRGGEPLGAITLVRTSAGTWSPDERMLIDELTRRASMAVENARLYLTQRRASETLQSSLLTQLPHSHGLQVSARYHPALEGVDVGGDWYDAFPLGTDATAIAIGDVMGHDLAAAARMGQLRNMLRTLAYDRHAEPSELLQRVDRVAEGLGVEALATCVFGILSPSGEADGAFRLRWSSAGHLPPVVLRRAGACTLLDGSDDLMLGIVADTPRHDNDVLLHPGDTVILVTDGLVETRDGSLDDGLTHLRRNAVRAASRDLDELCDELVSSMSTRVNNDDVAVIAVRVRG